MSDEPSDLAWKHVKVHLASMLGDIEKDYTQFKNTIEEEEKKLVDDLAVIRLIHDTQDKSVDINVGGRVFSTTMETLKNAGEESMLGTMFSGKYELEYNEKGEIYIDREGKYFHFVLEFLREGYCLMPDNKEILLKVAKEAEFYGLEGLLKLLRIQYRVNPPKAVDLADLKGDLSFFVWGSGGENSNRSGNGGAGGFSWGRLSLQDIASFDFNIVVGDFATYGGGGISPIPSSSSYNTVKAGNGGGYSGVFDGTEPLLIAGGGGGGGNGGTYHGGAGGGERGQDGTGPSTTRSGKGAGQSQIAVDGESSYGGTIRGLGAGKLKGGDGALGSNDGGAGGGGGYYGGGGGGEGGGIDGPAGGGGSGFISPLLKEKSTTAGNKETACSLAIEYGYSNNNGCVGRVKVVWDTDSGPLEIVFSKPGEYELNPLTFQMHK